MFNLLKPFLVVAIFSILAGCAGIGPFQSDAPQYVVKKGDTLYSIAWQAGKDVREVAALNAIRQPYTIYPGQVIKLSFKSPVVSSVDVPKKSVPAVATRKTPSWKPSTALASKPTSVARLQKQTYGKWRWPAKGRVLKHFSPASSGYKGIDIIGKLGDPIKAAAAGKVVYSGQGLLGYGNLIIIKHNEDYLSAYAHNQKLFAKEGDNVQAGQIVAQMGNTGTNRVKLYFEMRYAGKPIDPLKLLSNSI